MFTVKSLRLSCQGRNQKYMGTISVHYIYVCALCASCLTDIHLLQLWVIPILWLLKRCHGHLVGRDQKWQASSTWGTDLSWMLTEPQLGKWIKLQQFLNAEEMSPKIISTDCTECCTLVSTHLTKGSVPSGDRKCPRLHTVREKQW